MHRGKRFQDALFDRSKNSLWAMTDLDTATVFQIFECVLTHCSDFELLQRVTIHAQKAYFNRSNYKITPEVEKAIARFFK